MPMIWFGEVSVILFFLQNIFKIYFIKPTTTTTTSHSCGQGFVSTTEGADLCSYWIHDAALHNGTSSTSSAILLVFASLFKIYMFFLHFYFGIFKLPEFARHLEGFD